MPSKKTTPININITNDDNDFEHDDTNQLTDLSQYKEYIIKTNIILQNESKELRDKIKDLETEISNNELEQDKNDNRIRYMKGLMNNINEIKNLYIKLYENDNILSIKSLDDKLYKNIKDFDTKNIIYIIVIILWNLVTTLLIISSYTYKIFVLFINIIIILQIYYLYKTKYQEIINNTINNKNKSKEILNKSKQFKQEIKELENSTVSLDNWICEI